MTESRLPPPPRSHSFTNPSSTSQSFATSCGSWPSTSTLEFSSCAIALFSFAVIGARTSAIAGCCFRALLLISGAAL